MRNLKRVLSLALASVMLLGMMVIGAGAADKVTYDKLTDKDKITNKESVSLMVDLGIIVGKPDGSYAPAEVVDRATMAKLITYIQMGDVDQSIFKGTATNLTDVDGTWAEGYIKYCYANGIITGDGIGHFFPTQSVSVVAAAKMLLVALGYDAAGSKYVNDSMWSVNIMKDAQSAGLLNGISQKSTEGLTRDNAALMIYNALFANTVKANYAFDMGVKYLTGYTQGETLGQVTYGLVKVTGVVVGITNGKGTFNSVTPAVSNLSWNNTLKATPDMVGSTASFYVKGTVSNGTVNASKMISTALTIANNNVVATNAGYSKTGTEALTALLETASTKIASLESGKTVSDLAVYFNGALMGGSARTTAVAKIGKAGIVTDFKNTNTTAGVDTLVITEKTVATLAAAPVVTTDSKGSTVVTITTLGLTKVDASTVVGYENLAKGDVILYVTIGGVTYIEKAASVSGVVAGQHSTKGLLVDGSYYLTSTLAGRENSWSNDFTNTYTFYLDNGKNIVKAVKNTDAATTANYAVVSKLAWVTGSGIEGSNYVEAKLIFTDGTTKVVKIDSVNGVKAVAAGSAVASGLYKWNSSSAATATGNYAAATYFYTKSGADYTAKYFGVENTATLTAGTTYGMNTAGTAASNNVPFAALGQFYSYTVNADGAYLLSTPKLTNGQSALATLGSSSITNGLPRFDGSNVGNVNTVFVYETPNGDGVKHTAYTGIANAPSTSAAAINAGEYAVVLDDAGYAAFVFVKTTATQSASTDWVYFTSSSYTTMNAAGVTFYLKDAIINGEASTLKVNEGDKSVTGMYTVTSVSDAGISTVAPATGALTGIAANSGSTLLPGSGNVAYTYTADTKAFYIADGKSTEISAESIALDANDELFVIPTVNGGTVAKTIYVIQKDASAPVSVTLSGASSNGATVSGTTDIKAGTAAVTSWTAENNKIKVAATAASNYTVKSVSVGGVVTNGAAVESYGLTTTTAHTLTVVVTVADNFSGVIEAYSYVITVPAVTA